MNKALSVLITSVFVAGSALAQTTAPAPPGGVNATGQASGGVTAGYIAIAVGVVAVAVAAGSSSDTSNPNPITAAPATVTNTTP